MCSSSVQIACDSHLFNACYGSQKGSSHGSNSDGSAPGRFSLMALVHHTSNACMSKRAQELLTHLRMHERGTGVEETLFRVINEILTSSCPDIFRGLSFIL